MQGDKLSVVTYTYNDGDFARNLVKEIHGWGTPVLEILVVDDGSRPAFSDDGLPECRVLRLEDNRGPARAKQLGISACRGDFILSIDCDVRPDPLWLERALAKASDPGAGLIGAPVLAAGKDAVSRYVRSFGTYAPGNGRVELVSGEIWLMRKAVWEAAGGFGDFAGRTHEDFYFSRRVRSLGLDLLLIQTPPVFGVRRLSRVDYVRRHVSYSAALAAEYIERQGLESFGPLVGATAKRLAEIRGMGDPALAYIELLKFTAFALSLLFEHDCLGERSRAEGLMFCSGLESILESLPETRKLLKADMAALGIEIPGPPDAGAGPYWSEAFGILESAGAFEAMEHRGVPEVQADEQNGSFDFHYLRTDS